MTARSRPDPYRRGARLASAVQRLALYARDRGCNRPGCDMPPQWTQVHHLDEYQYGGLTDVETMCLVCPFDHPLITEHCFTVRVGAHGRVEWIAPKHLDPSQTPPSTPSTTRLTSRIRTRHDQGPVLQSTYSGPAA